MGLISRVSSRTYRQMDFSLQLPKLKEKLEEIVSQYGKLKKTKKVSESSDNQMKKNQIFFEDDGSSALICFALFNSQGVPICSAGAQGCKADNLRLLGGLFARMIVNQQHMGEQLSKIKYQKTHNNVAKERHSTAGSDLLKDEESSKTKNMRMFYEFTNKCISLETFYPK